MVELRQNNELVTQASDLMLAKEEQSNVLESSSEQLTEIKTKLKEYKEAT